MVLTVIVGIGFYRSEEMDESDRSQIKFFIFIVEALWIFILGGIFLANYGEKKIDTEKKAGEAKAEAPPEK